METSNFRSPISSDEHHHDLYTIPSYSSWFSWSNIHEIERISLREFFDGSSIMRTPRIYKEYRDFIISKYREDPSRRLTFTELRKSLVGDVSILQKVFTFLEKWGLINFSGTASSSSVIGASTSLVEGQKEDEKWNIRVEEGAPHGVRVVAAPNSLKPVTAPPPPSVVDFGSGAEVAGIGSKFPPLASYSDIYEELMHQQQQQGKESLVCGSCKDRCDSGHYEYSKDASIILCKKCFDNKNFEKDKSVDDFKFIGSQNQGVVWTEAETLLLLESVLKHGDDWEVVAQNVKTKSKMDCISKLLQLPFGDLMLGSAFGKNKIWDISGDVPSVGKELSSSGGSQEIIYTEDNVQEHKEDQQHGIDEEQEPPRKRLCTVPVSDTSSALMKQVARLSSVVGPRITAAAAEAAVTELCYENRCTKEILDEEKFLEETGSSPRSIDQERDPQPESLDGQTQPTKPEINDTASQKNVVSLTLRMRAATATALGAAAAHAKLLANQEEREIEHIIATIIETQLKKLQNKVKHLEELERIMEKQSDQIEGFEEYLLTERMSVLEEIFQLGISSWKDQLPLKPSIAS